MRRHGRLSRPATSSSVPHARHDSRPARVRRGGIAADRRGRWEFLPRETAPSSPDRVRDVVPFGDVRGAGVQEVMPSVPVLAIHAYDLAYGPSVPANTTVLGVSHSGSTPTTNRALRRAHPRGSRPPPGGGRPGPAAGRVAGRPLGGGPPPPRAGARTPSA